jgi:hypothetical protein
MSALIYRQGSGELLSAATLALIGVGYSGNGLGLNNPGMERMRDVGPIPRGEYDILPPLDPAGHLGPLAFPLRPRAGTETYGRSDFLLHADNFARNHTASHGCIIQDRPARLAVLKFVGGVLTVVQGPARKSAPAPAPSPVSADDLNAAELANVEHSK